MNLKISHLIKAMLAVMTVLGSISYAQTPLPTDPIDLPLKQIDEKIQSKDWDSAKQLNLNLRISHPNLKLTSILSDLIEKQQPLEDHLPKPLSPEDDEFNRENLLAELSLRMHYASPFTTANITQDSILKLAESIKYAVLIDVHTSRLYLLKNHAGKLSPVADYYIGIGKQGIYKTLRGDHRTPIGVYTISEYIPDRQLPELYGIGAFPIDYPNTWDQRLKHTGSGIWLHGVPRSTYSRGPRSSRGCVTISNDLFSAIQPYIEVKQTPLIIAKKVNWQITQNKLESEILLTIQRWQDDWQSLNSDAYLEHYHSNFRYKGGGLDNWSAYKRQINLSKKFIHIKITNLSIFNYPLEENLVLTRYTQSYQSDHFNSIRKKEQYWKKESGRWKIISEKVL